MIMVKELYRDVRLYEGDCTGNALDICKLVNIDIMFVDISLKDSSGLEFAREIRKMSKYKLTWIIFVTSHINYMIEAFKEIHCYDYLLKPYSKEDVNKILTTLVEDNCIQSAKINNKDKYVFLSMKDCELKVYIKDIIFIEIMLTTCMVHTIIGKYKLTGISFKSILAKINDPSIIQCHKSFAININYIKEIQQCSQTSFSVSFYDYEEKAFIGAKFKDKIKDYFELDMI